MANPADRILLWDSLPLTEADFFARDYDMATKPRKEEPLAWPVFMLDDLLVEMGISLDLNECSETEMSEEVFSRPKEVNQPTCPVRKTKSAPMIATRATKSNKQSQKDAQEFVPPARSVRRKSAVKQLTPCTKTGVSKVKKARSPPKLVRALKTRNFNTSINRLNPERSCKRQLTYTQ
eukprot:TRINITY_DN7594_c0_g1_i1.p1 TRINITY_DN7594_c0_g1~~TRINITY_DN7594_c0_g1_i1.p1  ORF type:complete len:178 (+),score=31.38 TRINITY_DN7594_c0_g1_i1:313-846(+)